MQTDCWGLIIGKEQDVIRRKKNSFSVEKYNLTDCDVLGEDLIGVYFDCLIWEFLVVPWIDMKGKSDKDYSDMCFNMFR